MFPAFASSRIGSRSGDVRYDKFSGCSSASFNRQAFPILLSLQESLTYFILPSPLLLSLSCVLVTCPIHLLPQAAHIATTTSYSCCLVIGSALRVVVHASAVYISLSLLLSYRVICWGIMIHGFWIYLLEIITLTLLLITKIVSRGICEPLCESIGTLTR